MDLITTLSTAGGGSTAHLGATTGHSSDGAEGSADAADERFVATLAELLAPLPADVGSFAELAEPTDGADEEPDGGAVAWPLGLLFAATSTPSDAEAADEPLADAPMLEAPSSPDGEEVATSPVTDAADVAPDVRPSLPTDAMAPGSEAAAAGATPDADHLDGEAAGTDPTSRVERAGVTDPTVAAPTEESDGGDDPGVARASRRSDTAEGRGESTNPASERSAPRSATEESVRASERSAARSATEEAAPASDATSVDATRGSGPPAAGPSRMLGSSDALRRVLDAIERLENAPPPRQLTIDAGEARLRVALDESNHVRLSVLDGVSDDVDDLLRAVEEALTDRGFDLDPGDRGDGGEPSRDDAPATSAASPSVRTERAAARGLRL